MSTQIRGNKQIQGVTISNAEIAVDAAIQTTKLAEGSELIKRDGSVAFTDNVNLDFNQIKNLGVPVDDDDAVRKSDLDEVAARVNGTLINRETVSGVKDGQNATFNLLNTPTLGTEQIFLNGALLNAGANADYSISGSIITMTLAPLSGDTLLANYIVDGIQINTDVQAALNQFDGRLTSVEGELFDAEVAIVQLGDADDAMSSRVGVVEADVSALEVRATNIESNVSALQSGLAAEITRAENVEDGLDTRLTSAEFEILGVKTRMTAAEGDVSSLESADIALDSRISTLEDGLQTETSQRISSYNSINSRVTALENVDGDTDVRLDAIEADIDTLESSVSSEAATRLSADNTLQSNINSEIAARTSAVSAVQSNLNTEISDRTTADNALDARIDALESNPTTQTYVDAEVSAVDVRVDGLVSDLAQEVLDRIADVDAEETRAMGAESALDARIDALESAPTPVTSYNDLTDKPSLFDGAYASLSGKPSLFSGSYNDLSNKPAIPSPVREVPTGSVNGTNATFTLSQAPSVPNTEQVFLNGLLQFAGAEADYTMSGDTITFNGAPETGWKIIVYYFL